MMALRGGVIRWVLAFSALCALVACSDDDDGDGAGGSGAGTSSGAFRGSCDVPSMLCQDHYGWSDSALDSIKDSCQSTFQGTWSSSPCGGSYCGSCSVGNSSYGTTVAHYVDSCSDSLKQACEQDGSGVWSDN